MLINLQPCLKHDKIMHYESITQFLSQFYKVLVLRKDRSKSINAALEPDIA